VGVEGEGGDLLMRNGGVWRVEKGGGWDGENRGSAPGGVRQDEILATAGSEPEEEERIGKPQDQKFVSSCLPILL
jgi:hypothetical protein